MARRLYTILYYLLIPLVLLRLFYRSWRAPQYRKRISERFGFFSPPTGMNEQIWIHSVSVGETIAAKPIIDALKATYPHREIVVTTMTPTGSAQIRASFGREIFHVYAPYDLPGAIKRFLTRVKPKLLIIIETELWPNMLHYCQQAKVPVVLANARLSEKSANGYQRFKCLSKPLLQSLNVVAAQHQADAERFQKLGVPSERITITGSIKFDLELSNELRTEARQVKADWQKNGRFIWVAASTHEGEDELLLLAFKQLLCHYSNSLLILVPRHPERFNSVHTLVKRLEFSSQRRSAGSQLNADTQVLVGDTMGELLLLYGCADVAFVGGSLVERGGHNMLEPAAWGIPVVTGPSDFNFQPISETLQECGALEKVSSADELANWLIRMVTDADARVSKGDAGRHVVNKNRGALQRLMTVINGYLKEPD